MLRIFRTLRNRFLSQNHFGRYALYALGEILLVVIGILIALQINNWNEERANREYQRTMLLQVREALETDVRLLEDEIPYAERYLGSVHALVALKNDPSLPQDSLYTHLQRVMSYGAIFTVNQSPYDAIVSGGLDRISNPEIRKGLSQLYGFTLENAKTWINEVLRTELFDKKQLFARIFGLKVTMNDRQRMDTSVRLTDPSVIYDNPDFDLLLSTSGWVIPGTLANYRNLIAEMRALSEQIDTELKNLGE
ncbi:DUF6090 family protein [Robiginitalea sp. SC105]|uniref:DUF6090 family protein n=1 Tax=Robiginitalea sp. SC105 TaxID=2762332 RepID=UPI00163AE3BA|nr:DUF6090 family protein [Robiginitalea sp. SC105]MBC2838584.1 hypothetical protein [Robiginitalea sp. SC105]